MLGDLHSSCRGEASTCWWVAMGEGGCSTLPTAGGDSSRERSEVLGGDRITLSVALLVGC